MKKTTKVILSSALTMGLCASLITGSTLAMFSSRSNVNVAITSGKVDVVASVDTDSLTGYSTEWDNAVFEYVQKPTSDMLKDGLPLPDNTFYAGGTYTYEAGELKLDSIAPGDAVEFNLKIENNSTLAIQYRVQLTVPTENQNGEAQGSVVKELQVSFNDEDPVTIGDESTFAQPWSAVIDKGVEITETPKVRVELPYELGNDYQGQNCLLHVGVYAVQLGTHVANAEGTYSAHTAADFLALSNLAQTGHSFAGETIALGANIDLSTDSDGGASTLSIALADTPATIAEKTGTQREWYFGSSDGQFESFKGTFNGNGFTISGFRTPTNRNHDDGVRSGYGLFRSTNGAVIENLIVENVTLELNTTYQGGNTWIQDQSGRVGIIAGQATNTTFRNIIVRNSSVTSITDYTKKCRQFGGSGNKGARTLEEYYQNQYSDKPLVGYDFVGALAGQIKGETIVENVNITLNEDSDQLTGIKLFGNTPFGEAESALLDTQANQKSNYTLTFNGTSTVVCEPAVGIAETLVFNEANNGSNETAEAPQSSVEIGSAEGIVSLAKSVESGRDFSGMTITLTDDIDLSESALETIGAFKGTIDGGEEGHIISGLDLNYFSTVSPAAAAASLEESAAPTLKNVTLEFTQFTGEATNWKKAYVFATQNEGITSSAASFVHDENLKLDNATIALVDDGLRYELHYGAPTEENNKLIKVSYIGLSDEWGDPETGDGYSETITDEHILVDTNVEYINFKFTGDTYLNIQGGTETDPIVLTLDHCLADVNPAIVSGNGRAAFIASRGEGNHVRYELTNNTIRSAQSTYDSFSAAIFSWANTANGSKFESNHFGKDDPAERYTFVAVKLMNFDPNAKVKFTDNDVYGTGNSWEFDAFDLFQNNSRANTYSAIFRHNRVHTVNTVESPHDTYFLYVEANILNNDNPAHGQVYVTSDNYFNDVEVDYAAYDPATFNWEENVAGEQVPTKRENANEGMAAENIMYSYNFVSWKVALNDADLITSGTFVLGAAFTESDLRELATSDAELHIYNKDTGMTMLNDAYVVDSAAALLKLGQYVQEQEAALIQLNAILTADLNMADVVLPEEWGEKVLHGTIDGRGHILYGMGTGKSTDYTQKTIFGNMDANSEIKHISFVFEKTISDRSSLIRNSGFFKTKNLSDVLIVTWNSDGTDLIYGKYWFANNTSSLDSSLQSNGGAQKDGAFSKEVDGVEVGFSSLKERLANYPNYPD